MAEPLTSKAWVAAWLQKAEHEIETAERSNASRPTHAPECSPTQLNVHCVRQQAAMAQPEVALITAVTGQDGACLSELLHGQARHRPGTRPSRMMDR